MAAVLQGSARTTPRVRAELQAAQASSRALAAQYGLNPKTVLKWRKRSVTVDAPMGPKLRSTVLTEAEEAIIVEFRRRTLLPLDDVMGCLRDAIPRLTRSALHLRGVVAAFPYQIHTVLTDNGVAFTKNASAKWDTMSGVPLARRATCSTACAMSTESSTG